MKSSYRWVIVACGALMTCVGIGAMFSLAVYLQPMSVDTGWSRTGISTAMTLDFLVMGAAGFGWGAASDRLGPRVVVMCGALLLGTWVGARELCNLAAAVPTHLWGDSGSRRRRVLCTHDRGRYRLVRRQPQPGGVAGLRRHGGCAHDDLAAGAVAHFHLRLAHRDDDDRRHCLGAVDSGPRCWCDGHRRLPHRLRQAAPDAFERFNIGREAFRSPQFIVLAATFFLCCAAHSGPIFHMVSYAIGCGIAPIAAVSASTVSKVCRGLAVACCSALLADRFGAKRVLVTGLLVQALRSRATCMVNRLTEFYALAVVFGTAYGGVMPLYAVLAREYFGQRIMGTVFGAATMVSSLGMAFGPLGGGSDLRCVRQLCLALHRGLHRCAWRSRRLPGLHRAVATACVATRPTKRAADARHGITASVCSHTRSCRISSERVSGWQRLR